MTVRVLQHMPSMLSLYAKALRKKAHSGEWPSLAVAVQGVRADTNNVRQYARLCHFSESRYLPATWLHTQAFPLHIQLLTDPAMPFKPMGMVHLRNRIQQMRPIEKNELLYVQCALSEEVREGDAGQEFDIITRIEAAGETVWESVTTNLNRMSNASSGNSRSSHYKPKPEPVPPLDIVQTWQLPANLGRNYAAISGDRNPIHLWGPTAKLFGFKRPIIHGMWSKARCLGSLQPLIGDNPFSIEVAFKTPAYLPSSVLFSYNRSGDKIDFQLASEAGKPHLKGLLQRL